ncbi:MAG: BACON domain-containing protein [Paludibacteraceae bacterium]|nr:BACON domain-containing protein [Paludibacteraceae bacterium]
MKRYFIYLAIALTSLLSFNSCCCEDADSDDYDTHYVDMLDTYKSTERKYKFFSNGDWYVESDSEWCQPQRWHGHYGHHTLRINIEKNRTGEKREAKIYIINNCSDEEIVTIYISQPSRR